MKPLRVVSYNIRKAVGLDWRRDPARVLAVLAEIDADLVLLQEADKRLGARPSALPRFLIAQETDYAPVDLADNDVSLGWHGNAILARRGLAIGPPGRLPLPGLEPRGAVAVEVAGMVVIGCHLGLLRRWRHRQMRALLSHLGSDVSRTMILGDFNEWSNHRGFEPWDGPFARVDPGPSFHASLPLTGLDGIVYGPRIALGDYGLHVTPLSRRASDHLPIWAEAALVPDPRPGA